MTLLVDSSVWIDFFNGRATDQTDYLDSILGLESIIVGDLILTEVLQGFRQQDEFDAALYALTRFSISPMVGQQLAIKSASNYRYLRSIGITVCKTIDTMIATFCIDEELTLLHLDRDFDPFERHLGLKVWHLRSI